MYLSSVSLNYTSCNEADTNEHVRTIPGSQHQRFQIPKQLSTNEMTYNDSNNWINKPTMDQSDDVENQKPDCNGNNKENAYFVKSCLEDSGFLSGDSLLLRNGDGFTNTKLSVSDNQDILKPRKLKCFEGGRKMIGPCQQLCSLLKEYQPGHEMEFYRKIIQECRLYLQESLLMKDRKRITRIYLNALEKLFKLYSRRDGTNSVSEMPRMFQPSSKRKANARPLQQNDDDHESLFSSANTKRKLKDLKVEVKHIRDELKKCKQILKDPEITSDRKADTRSDISHLRRELALLKTRVKELENMLKQNQQEDTPYYNPSESAASSISETLVQSLNTDLIKDSDSAMLPSRVSVSSPTESLLTSAVKKDLMRTDSTITISSGLSELLAEDLVDGLMDKAEAQQTIMNNEKSTKQTQTPQQEHLSKSRPKILTFSLEKETQTDTTNVTDVMPGLKPSKIAKSCNKYTQTSGGRRDHGNITREVEIASRKFEKGTQTFIDRRLLSLIDDPLETLTNSDTEGSAFSPLNTRQNFTPSNSIDDGDQNQISLHENDFVKFDFSKPPSNFSILFDSDTLDEKRKEDLRNKSNRNKSLLLRSMPVEVLKDEIKMTRINRMESHEVTDFPDRKDKNDIGDGNHSVIPKNSNYETTLDAAETDFEYVNREDVTMTNGLDASKRHWTTKDQQTIVKTSRIKRMESIADTESEDFSKEKDKKSSHNKANNEPFNRHDEWHGIHDFRDFEQSNQQRSKESFEVPATTNASSTNFERFQQNRDVDDLQNDPPYKKEENDKIVVPNSSSRQDFLHKLDNYRYIPQGSEGLPSISTGDLRGGSEDEMTSDEDAQSRYFTQEKDDLSSSSSVNSDLPTDDHQLAEVQLNVLPMEDYFNENNTTANGKMLTQSDIVEEKIIIPLKQKQQQQESNFNQSFNNFLNDIDDNDSVPTSNLCDKIMGDEVRRSNGLVTSQSSDNEDENVGKENKNTVGDFDVSTSTFQTEAEAIPVMSQLQNASKKQAISLKDEHSRDTISSSLYPTSTFDETLAKETLSTTKKNQLQNASEDVDKQPISCAVEQSKNANIDSLNSVLTLHGTGENESEPGILMTNMLYRSSEDNEEQRSLREDQHPKNNSIDSSYSNSIIDKTGVKVTQSTTARTRSRISEEDTEKKFISHQDEQSEKTTINSPNPVSTFNETDLKKTEAINAVNQVGELSEDAEKQITLHEDDKLRNNTIGSPSKKTSISDETGKNEPKPITVINRLHELSEDSETQITLHKDDQSKSTTINPLSTKTSTFEETCISETEPISVMNCQLNESSEDSEKQRLSHIEDQYHFFNRYLQPLNDSQQPDSDDDSADGVADEENTNEFMNKIFQQSRSISFSESDGSESGADEIVDRSIENLKQANLVKDSKEHMNEVEGKSKKTKALVTSDIEQNITGAADKDKDRLQMRELDSHDVIDQNYEMYKEKLKEKNKICEVCERDENDRLVSQIEQVNVGSTVDDVEEELDDCSLLSHLRKEEHSQIIHGERDDEIQVRCSENGKNSKTSHTGTEENCSQVKNTAKKREDRLSSHDETDNHSKQERDGSQVILNDKKDDSQFGQGYNEDDNSPISDSQNENRFTHVSKAKNGKDSSPVEHIKAEKVGSRTSRNYQDEDSNQVNHNGKGERSQISHNEKEHDDRLFKHDEKEVSHKEEAKDSISISFLEEKDFKASHDEKDDTEEIGRSLAVHIEEKKYGSLLSNSKQEDDISVRNDENEKDGNFNEKENEINKSDNFYLEESPSDLKLNVEPLYYEINRTMLLNKTFLDQPKENGKIDDPDLPERYLNKDDSSEKTTGKLSFDFISEESIIENDQVNLQYCDSLKEVKEACIKSNSSPNCDQEINSKVANEKLILNAPSMDGIQSPPLLPYNDDTQLAENMPNKTNNMDLIDIKFSIDGTQSVDVSRNVRMETNDVLQDKDNRGIFDRTDGVKQVLTNIEEEEVNFVHPHVESNQPEINDCQVPLINEAYIKAHTEGENGERTQRNLNGEVIVDIIWNNKLDGTQPFGDGVKDNRVKVNKHIPSMIELSKNAQIKTTVRDDDENQGILQVIQNVGNKENTNLSEEILVKVNDSKDKSIDVEDDETSGKKQKIIPDNQNNRVIMSNEEIPNAEYIIKEAYIRTCMGRNEKDEDSFIKSDVFASEISKVKPQIFNKLSDSKGTYARNYVGEDERSQSVEEQTISEDVTAHTGNKIHNIKQQLPSELRNTKDAYIRTYMGREEPKNIGVKRTIGQEFENRDTHEISKKFVDHIHDSGGNSMEIVISDIDTIKKETSSNNKDSKEAFIKIYMGNEERGSLVEKLLDVENIGMKKVELDVDEEGDDFLTKYVGAVGKISHDMEKNNTHDICVSDINKQLCSKETNVKEASLRTYMYLEAERGIKKIVKDDLPEDNMKMNEQEVSSRTGNSNKEENTKEGYHSIKIFGLNNEEENKSGKVEPQIQKVKISVEEEKITLNTGRKGTETYGTKTLVVKGESDEMSRLKHYSPNKTSDSESEYNLICTESKFEESRHEKQRVFNDCIEEIQLKTPENEIRNIQADRNGEILTNEIKESGEQLNNNDSDSFGQVEDDNTKLTNDSKEACATAYTEDRAGSNYRAMQFNDKERVCIEENFEDRINEKMLEVEIVAEQELRVNIDEHVKNQVNEQIETISEQVDKLPTIEKYFFDSKAKISKDKEFDILCYENSKENERDENLIVHLESLSFTEVPVELNKVICRSIQKEYYKGDQNIKDIYDAGINDISGFNHSGFKELQNNFSRDLAAMILDQAFDNVSLQEIQTERQLIQAIEEKPTTEQDAILQYANKKSENILKSSITFADLITECLKSTAKKAFFSTSEELGRVKSLQDKYKEGKTLFENFSQTQEMSSSDTMSIQQCLRMIDQNEDYSDEDKENMNSYLLLNLYGESVANKIISVMEDDMQYYIDIAPTYNTHSSTVDGCQNEHNTTYKFEGEKAKPAVTRMKDKHTLNEPMFFSSSEADENTDIQTKENSSQKSQTFFTRKADKTFENLKLITLNLKLDLKDKLRLVLPDYVTKTYDPRNKPTLSYKVNGENFYEELFVLYDANNQEKTSKFSTQVLERGEGNQESVKEDQPICKGVHPHSDLPKEELPLEECAYCFLQELSKNMMDGFTCLNEIDNPVENDRKSLSEHGSIESDGISISNTITQATSSNNEKFSHTYLIESSCSSQQLMNTVEAVCCENDDESSCDDFDDDSDGNDDDVVEFCSQQDPNESQQDLADEDSRNTNTNPFLQDSNNNSLGDELTGDSLTYDSFHNPFKKEMFDKYLEQLTDDTLSDGEIDENEDIGSPSPLPWLDKTVNLDLPQSSSYSYDDISPLAENSKQSVDQAVTECISNAVFKSKAGDTNEKLQEAFRLMDNYFEKTSYKGTACLLTIDKTSKQHDKEPDNLVLSTQRFLSKNPSSVFDSDRNLSLPANTSFNDSSTFRAANQSIISNEKPAVFENRHSDDQSVSYRPKTFSSNGKRQAKDYKSDGLVYLTHEAYHGSELIPFPKLNIQYESINESKIAPDRMQLSNVPKKDNERSFHNSISNTNTDSDSSFERKTIPLRLRNADQKNCSVQSPYKVSSSNNISQRQFHSKPSTDYGEAIIIDNGSGMIKAGLTNQEKPVNIPNFIGKPNYQKVFAEDENLISDRLVSWQADQHRGVLKLQYPMKNGIIEDWDAMMDVWSYTFQTEMRIDVTEHPLIMAENLISPKQHREKMMEIMLETYDVPAYYSALQGVMTLYSCGKITGIVLDSGDSTTQIVPVYEGYSIQHATEAIKLGGRDVTERLRFLIGQRGKSMSTTAEFEIVKLMKEKFCFVNDDNGTANEGSNNYAEFELPDGNRVYLDEERYNAAEILFDPSLIGREHPGFHVNLHNAIQKCDLDLRSDFYSNIILTGGSCLFPGMNKRMLKEMQHRVTYNVSKLLRILDNKDGIDSVWKGAKILSSLSTFSDMWISRDEYFEHGSNIVHMKCF